MRHSPERSEGSKRELGALCVTTNMAANRPVTCPQRPRLTHGLTATPTFLTSRPACTTPPDEPTGALPPNGKFQPLVLQSAERSEGSKRLLGRCISRIALPKPNRSPAAASPRPQTGGYAHSPDERTRLHHPTRWFLSLTRTNRLAKTSPDFLESLQVYRVS